MAGAGWNPHNYVSLSLPGDMELTGRFLRAESPKARAVLLCPPGGA